MLLYGQSFSFDVCISNPTIATVHSVHSNLDAVLTGIAKSLDRLFLPLLSFFKHPFPPFITLGDSFFSVSDYYFNEKMCLLLERTVKGK